jgi:hypothetical protein
MGRLTRKFAPPMLQIVFTKPVSPRKVVPLRKKPKPSVALAFVVFFWGRLTRRNRAVLVLIGVITLLFAYHVLRTPSEVETQQSAAVAKQEQANRNYTKSLVDLCSQSSQARDYWTRSERSTWTSRCVSRIQGGASIPSVLVTD